MSSDIREPGHTMTPELPSRTQTLESLQQQPLSDVLILGGGINGLSTLRELAASGVNVTLVDKGDFSSGASAGSSHMIHGGIRYLENGEVRLVRESLQERNRLLANAPHYVTGLGTTIPIFSTFSGVLSAPLRLLTHRQGTPRERGALLIKIGLLLYDLFGRNRGTLPRHEFAGRKKTLQRYPAMNPRVRYTAHYSDACVANPERLALDVLREALSGPGSVRAINYVEAVGFRDGQVVLRDRATGRELVHRAGVVVNATGPWVDRTNAALGLDSAYMGGTKGSHIVVDNPALHDACLGREVFFENDDGRIVLIFPLGGKVLVGTTDIPIDNPDEATCTEEEVDYFIDLARHVFPGLPIDRSQIVYRYSGVRPLPAAGDVNPGIVSRDYRIVGDVLEPGQRLISLVGGKWTTFRALGEHLAHEVLATMNRNPGPSSAEEPIGGGRDFPRGTAQRAEWVAQHRGSLSVERVTELLDRYGTIARSLIESFPHGETVLEHVRGYSAEEIRWIIHHESVYSLSDITHRRTLLAFLGQLSEAGAREIADIARDELGWSSDRYHSELAQVLAQTG